jgi:hypothetical protein
MLLRDEDFGGGVAQRGTGYTLPESLLGDSFFTSNGLGKTGK